MRRFLVIVGFLFVLSAASTVARGAAPGEVAARFEAAELGANDPWPGFRHNAGHTGRSSSSGPLRPYRTWSYDMGGSTYSSPAVAENGTIYIGSADSVYAIARGGQRRWASEVGGYAVSSPAIGLDGTVFVGSRDGNMYAFNPSDGSHRWAPFQTGDEVLSSPTIGTDGTVYFGSFDGNLYALDPTTGTPRWLVSTGSEISASPAIGRDGTIYVGALNGLLYAIAPSGSVLWVFQAEGDLASSPAIGSDGTIYVGSLEGALYAVGPDGNARWDAPFPSNGEIVSSPAIGANGTIYVGSVDGNLYAINRDGTERWAFDAGAEIYSSPAVDAIGTVYVGSYGGVLYAVDAEGALRWSLQLDERIWSSPAIGANGALYVATTDGDPAAEELGFSGDLHAIGHVAFEVTFRTEPVAGEAQVVEVSDPESINATAGRLHYRLGGEREYREPVPLRSSTNGYEADIPAEAVTLRGIEYYVEFTGGQDGTATYPPANPRTRPAIRRVQVTQGTAADVELQAGTYAMVSVPVALDDPSIDGVLQDDYDAYDPTRWRVLRWENDGYREHPSIRSNLVPGAAVFINVRSGRAFDIDGGRSVDTSRPYRIALQPGWNQVANPFAFPVALADIHRDEAAVPAVAYWDGTEMCQEPSCVQVWQPWEGYFVLNTSDAPTDLFVRPIEAPESETQVPSAEEGSAASLIRLLASAGDGDQVDSQNWVGFERSGNGEAGSSVPEAPPLNDAVRLSLVDEGSRFARIVRPPSAEGAQWEIEITVRERRRSAVDVKLIAGERAIPDGFAVTVIDHKSGARIPLVDGSFTIVGLERGESRRINLVIGTESYREDVLERASARPSSFALDQNYPNPFNPETAIGYNMPDRAHVRLDVFDAVGRRVRTLVDGAQSAGHHLVRWDGRSDGGERVASGVYFYRLEAGPARLVKKMLLLR